MCKAYLINGFIGGFIGILLGSITIFLIHPGGLRLMLIKRRGR